MIPVKADIAGSVWKITSKVGDVVDEEGVLLIMESMKMEIQVTAPAAGTVKEIHVKEGDLIQEGATAVTLDAS
ncbi:MAG: biotin/lipoyl-binding protein [bacterium]|nr:biotin/lipoyl-binding protein [bacterium]